MLNATATVARDGPRRTLCIDMPVVYGCKVVLPMLAKLRGRNPELKIDARFSDPVIDIIKERLDAAVRIGPLSDSNLVGRVFD